jgi:hypothetical protein
MTAYRQTFQQAVLPPLAAAMRHLLRGMRRSKSRTNGYVSARDSRYRLLENPTPATTLNPARKHIFASAADLLSRRFLAV